MTSSELNPQPSVMKIAKQTIYFSSSEHMEGIPENSIDLIVTSPPYNRGKRYHSDSNQEYDDKKNEEEYLRFLKRVWKECLRVASDKAIFFLNIGDSAADQGISEKVVNSAVEMGWTRIQDIIWVKSIYGKGHYTPSGRNKRFNNVWEHIFLLVKDKKKYQLDPKAIGIPYADKSNVGRYGDSDLRDPGNVWHIWYEKTTGNTIKKGHEAPFPIGVPYQCMKAVPSSHSVLDPFLGTGTTLAAANALNIKGFGYELFPQKDLIQETILGGKNYRFPSTVLIPHYAQSIKTLISIISDPNFTIPTPRTKKKALQYQILLDTLQKLGISNSFKQDLKKTMDQ
ncbi:MAG: DNA-methyltransferase [Promethearchaeota archaeon]